MRIPCSEVRQITAGGEHKAIGVSEKPNARISYSTPIFTNSLRQSSMESRGPPISNVRLQGWWKNASRATAVVVRGRCILGAILQFINF
jgi:hypothetical protein